MIDALMHREHTAYREIGQRAVAHMLERASIALDGVICVATACSFKPHVATYRKATELMGVEMDEVLFVANHPFDSIGAKAAGMHTAYIDRRSRPFGITPHQPDIIAPDMKRLADMLVRAKSARVMSLELFDVCHYPFAREGATNAQVAPSRAGPICPAFLA
jgi:hypothetical protein